MDIEFDPAKDEANIAKHGVSLALAEGFDLTTAKIELDDRFDYGEDRFVALGLIGADVFVLIFTPRAVVRVISLRKANRRERESYYEA